MVNVTLYNFYFKFSPLSQNTGAKINFALKNSKILSAMADEYLKYNESATLMDQYQRLAI